MRRLVLAIVLSSVAMTARAEPPAAPGIGFADKPKAAETGSRWGDGKTEGTQPIEEPAKGAPYNLTHITYGVIIMLAMLAFTVWLIRRNTRQR
jgi:hypothetical protein